jgi:hypothetical protein
VGVVKGSKNNYIQIEQRAEILLQKRGISGHVAADRFVKDFKAYLIYFDATGVGSADTTMSLLENDSNLTDSNILNTNFRKNLFDLISVNLRNDTVFMKLFSILLDNNGKGIGQGELALPLILAGYSFSNDSDGMFDGKKVEVKKNGASLKPVETGLTEKGIVDKLNKEFWNGTVPGKINKKLFQKHISSVTNPDDYFPYFKNLYVGCDVSVLSEEVKKCYTDANKFCDAIGKFALREYQRVDGWHNIIYIDNEKQIVVNIADTNNIEGLGLKFSPKLSRCKDTQAISDGYVNVSI